MNGSDPAGVDAYIAAAPPEAQPLLRQLRTVIRAAAPDAVERISYRMPFYEQGGRVVYFAAFRSHVSVFIVGKARERFADEVAPYVAGRSTLRFPIDSPLPGALIDKLVRARVEELGPPK